MTSALPKTVTQTNIACLGRDNNAGHLVPPSPSEFYQFVSFKPRIFSVVVTPFPLSPGTDYRFRSSVCMNVTRSAISLPLRTGHCKDISSIFFSMVMAWFHIAETTVAG